MKYPVDCPCGRSTSVTAADAGSVMTCACGTELRIPPLSSLRTLVGRAAYEANTVEVVLRMIHEGALPVGDRCVLTGVPTGDVAHLGFDVEGNDRTRNMPLLRWGALILAPLNLAPLAFWYILKKRRPVVLQEPERLLLPILIAKSEQWRLRRLSQDKLKSLLGTVTIYAQLLDEHPFARIKPVRSLRE